LDLVVLVLELVLLGLFDVTFALAFGDLAGLGVAAGLGEDVDLDLLFLRLRVDIHAVWVRNGLGTGLVGV
jgi:hypothetical protein